jgi:hypothetical protein
VGDPRHPLPGVALAASPWPVSSCGTVGDPRHPLLGVAPAASPWPVSSCGAVGCSHPPLHGTAAPTSLWLVSSCGTAEDIRPHDGEAGAAAFGCPGATSGGTPPLGWHRGPTARWRLLWACT